MKVFIFADRDERRAIMTGPHANCWFTKNRDSYCGNQYLFQTIEVSESDYDVMVEYWDDCIDRGANPEILLP